MLAEISQTQEQYCMASYVESKKELKVEYMKIENKTVAIRVKMEKKEQEDVAQKLQSSKTKIAKN